MSWEWVSPTATATVSLAAIASTVLMTRRQIRTQVDNLARQQRHELSKDLLTARRAAYARYLLARDRMVMEANRPEAKSWELTNERPAVFGEFHSAIYEVILIAGPAVEAVLDQDAAIVFELNERGISLNLAKKLGGAIGAAMSSEVTGVELDPEALAHEYAALLAAPATSQVT